MNILLIYDGIISSLYFITILFQEKTKNKEVDKEKIVNKYYSLYKLDTFNKLILYSVVCYLPFSFIFVLPFVQNVIYKKYFRKIIVFNNKKKLYYKYIFSFIIYSIFLNENLKLLQLNKINDIKMISKNVIISIFLINYSIIMILNYLRNIENTIVYIYYKSFKMFYFTKFGKSFKTLSYQESLGGILKLIKCDYSLINDPEIINCLYRVNSNKQINYYILNYLIIKFLSLWSIVCYCNYMFQLNINEIQLTIYIYFYSIVNKLLKETIFFIINFNEIEKFIEMNEFITL